MEHTESEEPEEQGVMNNEAVDEAEQYFAIAKKAEGWVGIMLAIDESEAVEDEHDRGGESVMALQNHGQGEESADSQGDQKVETHFSHTAVESKRKVVSFGFMIGHDGDGGGADSEEYEGKYDGCPDTGRHWRQYAGILKEGQIESDHGSRDDCRNAGEEAYDDDGPAA